MGKAPAVVVITRHGARLDAEDRKWQDLATAPYDSPLSYGGWIQSRALGSRIAALLSARELSSTQDDNSQNRPENSTTDHHRRPSSSGSSSQKKRKQKIVIHSSPFLRCVQSAVAIGAGIAQFQGNQAKPPAIPHPRYPRHRLYSPARSSSMENRYMAAGRKGSGTDQSEIAVDSANSVPLEKPVLRIDGLLGEWLSQDYYELIVPPPSSHIMVNKAKEELVKSAETIQGATLVPGRKAATPPDVEQEGLETVHESAFSAEELAQALPDLGPNDTYRSRGTSATGSTTRTRSASASESAHGGYSPPVPTYALSPSEPIPPGYVAHARDACIDFDPAWDSMKEPLSWGDGGDFPEEWHDMHVRFRTGLAKLVSWYKEQGLSDQSKEEIEDENNIEDDIILIMVTHGAGCNALIGGLTNQPVLLDVGMGSLTMAVRKDAPALAPTLSPRHRRTSSSSSGKRAAIALAVHEEYDMRVVASTDHLKAGVDLLKAPLMQLSSPMHSIAENKDTEKPRRNSALGSIRRRQPTISTQVKPSPSGGAVATPTSAAGLWGGRKGSVGVERLDEEEPSPLQEPALNAGASKIETPASIPEDQIPPLEGTASLGRSSSQRGLWGGGGGVRSQQTQRRRTLSERPNPGVP